MPNVYLDGIQISGKPLSLRFNGLGITGKTFVVSLTGIGITGLLLPVLTPDIPTLQGINFEYNAVDTVNFRGIGFEYDVVVPPPGTKPQLFRNGNLKGNLFSETSGNKIGQFLIEAVEFIEDPTLDVQMRLKPGTMTVKGELVEG